MKDLEELRTEIDAMSATVGRLNGPFADLDGSTSEWLELMEAHSRLPHLVAVAQGIIEHLSTLERSALRHRRLAHDHQRNGDVQMSMRARLLANHEDRLHAELALMLTGLWAGAEESQSLVEQKKD